MSESKRLASVADYALLGRSGLRVSPLCLGAMTFGTDWGWGATADTCRRLVDRYLEVGGNFIDTADGYTNGRSEEILGEILADGNLRDAVVLATKFTFNTRPGDPNAGGNGRKNIYRALEGSLRRLRTDYVDLYWLHAWDGVTPVEEVLRTLDDLVRAGKIRAYGLSDTPAWYLARAHSLAEVRGWEGVAALQLEYSLVERNIEREHVPAALELGIGICPWSPLASGLLAGKYKRAGGGTGRLATMKDSDNPGFQKLNERNFAIVDVLVQIAQELGRSPAQVALSWITRRPGVTSTIIGATKPEQLEDNLAALELDIPAALSERLEAAGRPELQFPYYFFEPTLRGMITGGTTVRREPRGWRPR